jgi:hypothetical protein
MYVVCIYMVLVTEVTTSAILCLRTRAHVLVVKPALSRFRDIALLNALVLL